MFDPAIALNHHIALLKLKEMAAEEMGRRTSVIKAAARCVGQLIMIELRKSTETLRANKTWIAEQPLPDGRYRYSCMGHAGTHAIDEETLELQKRMIMKAIEDRIKRVWKV